MPILLSSALPVTAALAGVLFASLWQGTLLVLLVALGLRLLPGFTSAARAAIWAAVLVLVALRPVLTFAGRSGRFSAEAGGHAVHVALGFSILLVTVWGAASLLRFGQLVVAAAQLWMILRSAQPLASTPAITALLRAAPRHPQLCISADVQRPSVAGFFRPRLLVPADLIANLSEAELTQIVLHELEHLRRGDDWVNLLQQLALVLLPLHPALPWLNRRLALERELACDDAVLATTHAGKAYAACLAHVAECSLLQRSLSLALSLLGSLRRGSELTARVERILRRPERTLTGMPLRIATCLVLAGTTLTAGLLAHGPELVSFGPAGLSATATATAGARTGSLPGSRLLPVLATLPNASQNNIGHAVLLKAVMPAPQRLRDTRSFHRTAAPLRAGRRGARPAPVARVLLTGWQRSGSGPAEVSGPRMVPILFTRRLSPVLVETQQVWYTAVSFRNGWLVVQL